MGSQVDRASDVIGRVRRHAVEAILLVVADLALVALGIVPGPAWIPVTWGLAGVLAISIALSLIHI